MSQQEQIPYYQAARFSRKKAAEETYAALQTFVFEQKRDLSVYRFFQRYVTVVGERPDEETHKRIALLLSNAGGEAITLDMETLTILLARRAQQLQQGQWVEGHYNSSDQE